MSCITVDAQQGIIDDLPANLLATRFSTETSQVPCTT